MPHWKLTLAYDGTSFHGWQVQPRLATVQGTLSAALRHLTGEIILPQGSGRTDAGVHALAQITSFSLESPIPPANLLRALNRALPSSIRVLNAEQVPEDFHARHSALRKTYEYRLFPGASEERGAPCRICPPFLAPYVWDCPWPFDLALAQAAADCVTGEHDFTSFAASDPDLQTRREASHPSDEQAASPLTFNTRTIFDSRWHEVDGIYLYRVTGSGFLHHMVRNLVGTFVDAAAGRIVPNTVPAILAAKDRSAASPTAPARGLFLVNVEYAAHEEPTLAAPPLGFEMWDQPVPEG